MSNHRKVTSARKLGPTVFENSSSSDFQGKGFSVSIKPAKQSMVHAVTDFLQQNEARSVRQCGHCGGPLQSMNAYFWLGGTDVASSVALPFCPACEPDVLTALRRKTRHQ